MVDDDAGREKRARSPPPVWYRGYRGHGRRHGRYKRPALATSPTSRVVGRLMFSFGIPVGRRPCSTIVHIIYIHVYTVVYVYTTVYI